MELARRGDFQRAIATARQAVEAHQDDFGMRVFLAMLHVRRSELNEAAPHLRAAIAINPADPFPRLELIRVLIGLGEVDEAGEMLGQVELSGTEPDRLRAMYRQRRGEIPEAAELYRQLVNADPLDFESWGNLGLCLLAMDQAQPAIAAFERSLALRPDRLPTRLKWAEAHFACGTGERALAELRELAGRGLPNSNLWVAIAHLENLLIRPEQSLAALEKAVALDAGNEAALVALAEALERGNELKRLEAVIDQLASLSAPAEKLPLLRARLAYRRGHYEKALDLARSAAPSSDAGTRAQLVGQSLDRLGDSAGAFAAFVEMNAEDRRTGGATERKAGQSREDLAEQREVLTGRWVGMWSSASPPAREPAFLVGFPRSGTTLLDTFLMGHPGTAIAEEEPMLAEVGEKIGGLERLAEMADSEVKELRDLYWKAAKRHVPDADSDLLIDKNPMAMGSLPIVHRLFPTARILFMERHPCDVVLSCFMTRFQPTGFGTNFLTLRDTALLYDEMMQLWTKAAELLPLKVHRVRYERLVDDAETELRPAADFLGMDWRPELLDHETTAKKRAFIKTPSYAQVAEPVSNRPAGRWTRYRDQLGPVLPTLKPWADRMGYET